MTEIERQYEELKNNTALYEAAMRADLSFFAEEVLGLEIAPHHLEWSEMIRKNKRLAINAPRDHGKSYMFTFAYPIWQVWRNWKPEITSTNSPKYCLGYIFSFSQPAAIKFLRMIKMELMTNPKLQHLVPPENQKDRLWNQTEIKLTNGAEIRAVGFGTFTRGAHPAWAIIDDPLTDETLWSELIRMKDMDYYFSAISGMMVPGSQLVAVGTPFHARDLWGNLSQNPEYVFKKYQAIRPDGSVLWPTRYSKDQLEAKKREIGAIRFSREFLCSPISDEASLFPRALIEGCFEPEWSMPHEYKLNDLVVYTGVDLAMSTSVGADYTVITTIGVDKHGNRWLLDIRWLHGRNFTDQCNEIMQVYKAYRSVRILIEENQMQRVFVDVLRRHSDLPVSGFTTGATKNSLEKGVPMLRVLFENKKFKLPRKTERDRQLVDRLCDELSVFSWIDGKLQGVGGHDDAVMSLWLTNQAIEMGRFSFDFVGLG